MLSTGMERNTDTLVTTLAVVVLAVTIRPVCVRGILSEHRIHVAGS